MIRTNTAATPVRSISMVIILMIILMIAAVPAPAHAYDPPPSIDEITARVPSGDKPSARASGTRDVECATSGRTGDASFQQEPPASTAFAVNKLHEYATGKGVTVAVIDSGVNPNVRLPRLKGGGDYVEGKDGLTDCDHHGTLIAGIIAAQPSDKDGMVGVAPDATILSIRQSSVAVEAASSSKDDASSRLDTVAQAVVRATNLGASVINLSVTACASAEALVDTTDLGAALKYAHNKNVAVVASAGNANDSCYSNPSYDPQHPGDLRNWEGVQGISFPSYYAASGLLLSVGGIDSTDGKPYDKTMAGPWVSVAAPATNIVSLDPSKGRSGTLINARMENKSAQELAGTSFAAAYVTGLMTLLKEQHPSVPVEELYARVLRTAHTPSLDSAGKLGMGTVDAVAALTYDIDTTWPADPRVSSQAVPMPAHNGNSRIPMWIGIGVVSIAAVIVLLCLIGAASRRTTTKDKEIF
ncbi:type VII secretion-associated serine protease mycosin [Gordonia sihwensis]|uniref:type VII secretion-associated serine protease mycosin n=1 Tax=Gordonia sihwensis TaxID=173559 RepID=UPI003D975F3F